MEQLHHILQGRGLQLTADAATNDVIVIICKHADNNHMGARAVHCEYSRIICKYS